MTIKRAFFAVVIACFLLFFALMFIGEANVLFALLIGGFGGITAGFGFGAVLFTYRYFTWKQNYRVGDDVSHWDSPITDEYMGLEDGILALGFSPLGNIGRADNPDQQADGRLFVDNQTTTLFHFARGGMGRFETIFTSGKVTRLFLNVKNEIVQGRTLQERLQDGYRQHRREVNEMVKVRVKSLAEQSIDSLETWFAWRNEYGFRDAQYSLGATAIGLTAVFGLMAFNLGESIARGMDILAPQWLVWSVNTIGILLFIIALMFAHRNRSSILNPALPFDTEKRRNVIR
ncbi:MAG: hypothetical protein AAFR81_09955 [Chloroflexota bacterium]